MTIFEAPPGLYVVTFPHGDWVFFKPCFGKPDTDLEGYSPSDGDFWVTHTIKSNVPCRRLEVKP
jgi:hypothetical protein